MLHYNAYTQVLCIIDSLNVYWEKNMIELIRLRTNAFSSSATSQSSITKLLCTSRPESSVLKAWGPASEKILHSYLGDIEKFVHSRVGSLEEKSQGPLIEQLLSKHEKTYL